MIRTFDTHKVRRVKELTASVWDFEALSGENAGKKIKVTTPSCWETIPGYAKYRGEAVYTRSFTAGGNIRLEFKGVSHTATVYLDGELIAEHYNAYTIFSTVIANLPYGEHELKIKVSNQFSEESALHIPNDYMSYGGINRPVVLEELISDTYIERLHVTPRYIEMSERWTLDIEADLNTLSANDDKTYNLVLSVLDEKLVFDNISFIEGKAKLRGRIDFDKGACEEWTLDSPILNYITAELIEQSQEGDRVIDDYIDRFGFRRIEVKGRKILLNGSPVYIKGFCRHEDHPQYGCAIPYAQMAADLRLVTDMGGNSIRTSHYPNDELFLDLCDELGILVWEENHARGLSEEDMRNPNFERQAEEVIREMIRDHYNHPSIYIWGILNECSSDTEYGRSCYEKQYALIRELDKSRPTSSASCKFKTDICFDLPDVVSYNLYPLWYHDTPPEEYVPDMFDWVDNETDGAGKPFLITEIGAGAVYGFHSPTGDKWTESYQADAIRRQISSIFNDERISGVYLWQFCDCRVSEEWFHIRPRTMNNKGIVDEYRRPKLSYNVVKELYRGHR